MTVYAYNTSSIKQYLENSRIDEEGYPTFQFSTSCFIKEIGNVFLFVFPYSYRNTREIWENSFNSKQRGNTRLAGVLQTFTGDSTTVWKYGKCFLFLKYFNYHLPVEDYRLVAQSLYNKSSLVKECLISSFILYIERVNCTMTKENRRSLQWTLYIVRSPNSMYSDSFWELQSYLHGFVAIKCSFLVFY